MDSPRIEHPPGQADPDDDLWEMSPKEVKELRRRVADLKDKTRYMLVAPFLPGSMMYYESSPIADIPALIPLREMQYFQEAIRKRLCDPLHSKASDQDPSRYLPCGPGRQCRTVTAGNQKIFRTICHLLTLNE